MDLVKESESGNRLSTATRAASRSTVSVIRALTMILVLAFSFLLFSGCDNEDCINCVELPPPVVPTGVHSISGDNEVIVQWYDLSYYPYDGKYNENVTRYIIYSRFIEINDTFPDDREFFYIGEVAWDENFDPDSGLHWFVDAEAENGFRYEYAVAAENAAGLESALSYEFVTDAPLPMSPWSPQIQDYRPVALFDSPTTALGGFDFSRAAESFDLLAGRVDGEAIDTTADVKVVFEGDGDERVPFLQSVNPDEVKIQDFGVFMDSEGYLIFEGVSWAPESGYSRTGKLELIAGHIYVIEITDSATNSLNYAKLGMQRLNDTGPWVDIIWAYQLIDGLPELKVTRPVARETEKPGFIRL